MKLSITQLLNSAQVPKLDKQSIPQYILVIKTVIMFTFSLQYIGYTGCYMQPV